MSKADQIGSNHYQKVDVVGNPCQPVVDEEFASTKQQTDVQQLELLHPKEYGAASTLSREKHLVLQHDTSTELLLYQIRNRI